jgi:hypothetical protein
MPRKRHERAGEQIVSLTGWSTAQHPHVKGKRGRVILLEDALHRIPRMVFGRSVQARADGRALAIRTLVSAAQRDQLTELDAETDRDLVWEASAAAALRDLPLALDDVARLLGLASRADANRRVRLGRRPAPIIRAASGLAPTHLRLLSTLPDTAFVQWAQRIKRENLSVQALKQVLAQSSSILAANSADINAYARQLSDALHTEVRIAWGPDLGKRHVAIAWYTAADLLGMMERLGQATLPPTDTGPAKQRWITIHTASADELAAIFAGVAQS